MVVLSRKESRPSYPKTEARASKGSVEKKRGAPEGAPLESAVPEGHYFMEPPEAAFCILTSTFSVRPS